MAESTREAHSQIKASLVHVRLGSQQRRRRLHHKATLRVRAQNGLRLQGFKVYLYTRVGSTPKPVTVNSLTTSKLEIPKPVIYILNLGEGGGRSVLSTCQKSQIPKPRPADLSAEQGLARGGARIEGSGFGTFLGFKINVCMYIHTYIHVYTSYI